MNTISKIPNIASKITQLKLHAWVIILPSHTKFYFSLEAIYKLRLITVTQNMLNLI